MVNIDLVTLSLTWNESTKWRPAPQLLRGAIGRCFPNEPLVQQPESEQIVHRYPRIQYRWDQMGPRLLGIGDGAQFLKQTNWVGQKLYLKNDVVTVKQASCVFRCHKITSTPRLERYWFAAPWLPLSQTNYRTYQNLSPQMRRLELDRLAVAGVLLGLRSFGVDFRERLYVAFEKDASRPCRYKGVDLVGFTGQLAINADLPNGFALGRAVSHGYGWIVAVDPESIGSSHTESPAAERTEKSATDYTGVQID